MRRLLSSGLAVLSGVMSAPFAVAPLTPHTRPAEYKKDPRFERLRSFFRKFDCPAVQYAEAFLEAADRYELDWRLLPSLSYIESTGGKAAKNNNMFGWGGKQFATPVAGIHEVGYRLAFSNLYRDKSLDDLLTTYNPEEDYPERVKSVMRAIGPK